MDAPGRSIVPDYPPALGEAWAAHVAEVSSTYQVHEDRHTIEFAWYHPQTGEFMVAAEYDIRSGACVRLAYSGSDTISQ